ncbi:MAG: DoxX family protein [Myxococcota bacterium]
MHDDDGRVTGAGWAALFARWVLGLMFGMAGYWKVFELGPTAHAQKLFVDGFASTWIPTAVLWATGLAIPFVELIAGAALCLGLRVRESAIALGVVLVMVSYGHLLQEALYDTTHHIFPRLVLLLFVLMIPPVHDRWSIDGWLRGRR